MFGGNWKRSRSPIGLDLGTHCLRVVQLDRKASGWRLVAATSETMPPESVDDYRVREAFLADTLPHLLKAGGFTGRQIVTGLSTNGVTFKNLRVPCMPAEELRAAVEWEASDRLRFALSDVQLQYFDAGEVRQGEDLREEIILMAAPRDQVEAHVQTLIRCRLNPVAIEVAPAAIARCLDHGEHTADLQAPGRLIVDIGHTHTKVLMTRRGRVVFFKPIDIGGHTIDNRLATQLHIPAVDASHMRRQLRELHQQAAEGTELAQRLFGSTRREVIERTFHETLRAVVEELAQEIGLCLRYYSVTFRGSKPATLELVGGESTEPSLASMIGEACGMRAQTADPLLALDTVEHPFADEIQRNACAWTVAIGLAMRTPRLQKVRGAA